MSTAALEISTKLLNKSRELTPTEKVLVIAIQSLSKEKGYCYAWNSYLADSLGKDKTTISKSMTSLEDKGFITRTIERDERKMVTERKVSLTMKFFKKFVEELDGSSNQQSVKEKKETKKVIRISKKIINSAKYRLNKKNKPKQAPVEVNVSDEVKVALQDKLGLQADKVVEDLEKSKGSIAVINCINHVYQTQVLKKNQTIGSTNYLLTTFNNGFNGNCKVNKTVREEMKADYVDVNNKAWEEKIEREQKEYQERINTLAATEEEKQERLELLAKIPFGVLVNGKIATECTLKELRDFVYGLNK